MEFKLEMVIIPTSTGPRPSTLKSSAQMHGCLPADDRSIPGIRRGRWLHGSLAVCVVEDRLELETALQRWRGPARQRRCSSHRAKANAEGLIDHSFRPCAERERGAAHPESTGRHAPVTHAFDFGDGRWLSASSTTPNRACPTTTGARIVKGNRRDSSSVRRSSAERIQSRTLPRSVQVKLQAGTAHA
jgi:hypothetical protein